jgi:polyhydroxyalkanoate synthesis repressor PhaR
VLRVVKRYSNRKLYDTEASRYVTLGQIAEMVRAGENVRVIDNRTQEDKTYGTLALILSEQLKHRAHTIPVAALQALIRDPGLAQQDSARAPDPEMQPAWPPSQLPPLSEAANAWSPFGARYPDERSASQPPVDGGPTESRDQGGRQAAAQREPKLKELETKIAQLLARIDSLERRVGQEAKSMAE